MGTGAQTDVHLNSGVAPAVEDLARVYELDPTHERDPRSQCRSVPVRDPRITGAGGYFLVVGVGAVLVCAGVVVCGTAVVGVDGVLGALYCLQSTTT